MGRPTRTIDQLPLFSDDESIGEAVLGRERAGEFSGIATLLEQKGMPTISPIFGGRYVPSVKGFLDSMQGVNPMLAPLKEDGKEGEWPIKKDRIARV
jgi:hypothetical protein